MVMMLDLGLDDALLFSHEAAAVRWNAHDELRGLPEGRRVSGSRWAERVIRSTLALGLSVGAFDRPRLSEPRAE